MKIVLKVSSGNQDWDGGCAFAVVELSEVLATLAQRRIAALREQKNVDPILTRCITGRPAWSAISPLGLT